MTPVLFLINEREIDNPDLFAFFPDAMNAYSHIGQHSDVCQEYVNESRQATKEEYKDLLNELTNIVGYTDLTVLNN